MLLWMIAALAAFFIKGLCGFANTLVFTSIMGFGADNVNISPVELLISYPPNLILTWRYRRKLQARICVPLIILVIAGCIPGAFLLKNAGAGVLKIIFGILVILTGIEMLLREYRILNFQPPKIVLGIVGLLSGVLCGMFGVGALLAGFVSRAAEDTEAFKANISAVFIAENTFRIILYSVLGVITADSIRQAAILLPFMLAGLFAGICCSSRIRERVVKTLVIIVLIISGIVMIISNLSA